MEAGCAGGMGLSGTDKIDKNSEVVVGLGRAIAESVLRQDATRWWWCEEAGLQEERDDFFGRGKRGSGQAGRKGKEVLRSPSLFAA